MQEQEEAAARPAGHTSEPMRRPRLLLSAEVTGDAARLPTGHRGREGREEQQRAVYSTATHSTS